MTPEELVALARGRFAADPMFRDQVRTVVRTVQLCAKHDDVFKLRQEQAIELAAQVALTLADPMVQELIVSSSDPDRPFLHNCPTVRLNRP